MAAHVDPIAWKKKVRTRRIVLGIVFGLLLIAGVTLYLLRNQIIPAWRYARAERCLSRGDTKEAVELFSSAGTYRDANDRAAELAFTMLADEDLRQSFLAAEPGDTVSFGSYEQDNNPANGAEPIQWIVLEKKDGRMLLWSDYVLDHQPYDEGGEDITWADCTLRSWLNGSFYETAFNEAEQALIPTVELRNPNNSVSYTNGGKNTKDKVYILSFSELLDLGGSNLEGLYTYPTAYAAERGVNEHAQYGTCQWWMRTPGVTQNTACYCDMTGMPLYSALVNSTGIGVRPMIWVLVGSEN